MNDYDYTKPTPGPLHVEATSRQVDMANGAPRLLSKISHPGYLIVSVEPRGIVGLVNNERDAVLMAHAGDLLAALEELVNIVTHPAATKADMRQIAQAARAIIAQVKTQEV